jgi:protoporphyrinogen oxidase
VSAAFIWAIIRRMYAARRSGLKREMFGYVDGGYEAVLGAFEERLTKQGVDIVRSWPVATVEQGDNGVTLRSTDGRAHEADFAILTLSCPRLATVMPQLTQGERERLGRVIYQGIICASVLLTEPLGGFYVTNIIDAGFPFTTVIEMTALVDRARFDGHTLAYLPRYATADDAAWTWSDEEVRARFLEGLARMYPRVTAAHVRAFSVSRVREVLALSTLDYSRNSLPFTRTSLERVFVASSAQIANGTLNVNETVTLAEAKALEIAPRLVSSAPPAVARP